ncbi:putative methyltransferase [Geosmithia morbida]|uniref:Methyltransferase n=1 Tax=Geosmithia morbida TaxID=1094350 RepID=A0A9P5D3R0_9HYPO|nr:putative methyltransferase [Geosmithia morbida]KAF4126483.1 putative methyltransferase [Geosmithia morbida]
MADYISTPSPRNPLLSSGILSSSSPSSSSVLELGCGISPLLGICLSPHVGHYILSDQSYVHRLITQNLEANTATSNTADKSSKSSRSRRAVPAASAVGGGGGSTSRNISFQPLDWETDAVSSALSPTGDFDLVIACDCVFNYALVKPFIGACVDACRLRGEQKTPTVCLVAQQLRSDDVFQVWMAEFHRHFRVWRFPSDILPEELRPENGFVIHAGVLRE